MKNTWICVGLAMSASGCGILIGNVKPVEEKSDRYGVMDLQKENPKVWSLLSPSQEGADQREPETTATEIPDVAYQSSKTAAVISLNSSCRGISDPTKQSANPTELKELTRQLTFGIADVTQLSEENLTIQSSPALKTVVQGKMNGNEIYLKTLVLKRNNCVYDLLYMSPPDHFKDNELEFDNFVASLRIK